MDLAVSQSLLRRYGSCADLMDPGSKVLPESRLAALRDAESIYARATEHAEAITAKATQAYDEERRRGYADGQAAVRLEQATQVLENVARTIDYLEGAEDQIVGLVMQSVRKILHDFDDHERALAAVRSVLSMAREQKQVTLRLSPVEAERLKDRLHELHADYPTIRVIDVVPEKRLEGDRCILESDMGVIEASIEIQLAAIQAAFDKTVGRAR